MSKTPRQDTRQGGEGEGVRGRGEAVSVSRGVQDTQTGHTAERGGEVGEGEEVGCLCKQRCPRHSDRTHGREGGGEVGEGEEVGCLCKLKCPRQPGRTHGRVVWRWGRGRG